MIKGKRVLAVVPARSGSKGLKDKNVLEFLGKPLLAWSVEASIKSKYIDDTILSTDSQLIANVGRKYGAEVPFIRPHRISGDTTTSIEVVEHTVLFLRKELKLEHDILILLEPTSPLRTSKDIDEALEKLVDKLEARFLVSLGRVESQFPNFQLKETSNGFLISASGNGIKKSLRRQEIENHFFLDGTLYIAYIDNLLETRSFVTESTIGFLLPKWKNIEIDDEYDFCMALALGKKYL